MFLLVILSYTMVEIHIAKSRVLLGRNESSTDSRKNKRRKDVGKGQLSSRKEQSHRVRKAGTYGW